MTEPTVIARHINQPINADDFDNQIWGQCEPVQIDHYWSGEPASPTRHAEARVCWSDDALHVRFVGKQSEPLIVTDHPNTDKKTLGLWDRDVCELFIAPDARVVERYFEFEVAPTGEWLDAAIDLTSGTRETDWKLNSHMTTAAKIEKDRVSMAMRIPWNFVIHQPLQDECWRVNLFRCVGKDPNRGYLSWRPTRTPEPLFHIPGAFGLLVFA